MKRAHRTTLAGEIAIARWERAKADHRGAPATTPTSAQLLLFPDQVGRVLEDGTRVAAMDAGHRETHNGRRQHG